MYQELKDTAERVGLEQYCRRWPAFAWPGGYPIIYFTDDGAVLCPKCVSTEHAVAEDYPGAGWYVVGADINYEDDSCYCDNCGERQVEAYTS